MDTTENLKPDHQRNRRQGMRREPRTSAKVECRRGGLGLGKNLASQCLDVSEGGACLVLTEELAPQGEVEILIHGLNHGKPVKRLANVRWSVALDNGQFCAGVAFQKRLAFKEVQQFARP